MTRAHERLIDPKRFLFVENLQWIAEYVVEGFIQGLHASQIAGSGFEFNQYRSYQPGDPISRIDWKLWARSDRYFIREADKETTRDSWFVMDTSPSMRQQGQEQITKLDYAKWLSCCLTRLSQLQGDYFAMVTSSTEPNIVQRGTGQEHWFRQLITTQKLDCTSSEHWKMTATVSNQLIDRPSKIVILTDGYQQVEELNQYLENINGKKHEVTCILINDSLDRNLPLDADTEFKDLETGEKIVLAKNNQFGYHDFFTEFREKQIYWLNSRNIAAVEVDTREPLDVAMLKIIKAHKSLRTLS